MLLSISLILASVHCWLMADTIYWMTISPFG
ncbi:Uncharacterised protein [Vibrio cholerae]|nr:Uncharacterised protein [Vibrio cholerae]